MTFWCLWHRHLPLVPESRKGSRNMLSVFRNDHFMNQRRSATRQPHLSTDKRALGRTGNKVPLRSSHSKPRACIWSRLKPLRTRTSAILGPIWRNRLRTDPTLRSRLENWATKARANDCKKQVVACCSFFAQTGGVAGPGSLVDCRW